MWKGNLYCHFYQGYDEKHYPKIKYSAMERTHFPARFLLIAILALNIICISSTAYAVQICPPINSAGNTHTGNININQSSQVVADVPSYQALTRVDGDVRIIGHVSGLNRLHCVRTITGSLHISSVDGLSTIQLPNLRAVHGYLTIVDVISAASVNLKRLVSISRGLTIVLNSEPIAIDLSQLTNVNGPVNIVQNAGLTDVTLDKIFTVTDDFIISDNKLLNSCKFVEIAAKLGLQGYNNSSTVDTRIIVRDNDDSGMVREIYARSQAELNEFSGTTCVAESVTLEEGPFKDLSPLAELQFVLGEVSFLDGEYPEELILPSYQYGGDYLNINGNEISRVYLPRLERLSDLWVTAKHIKSITMTQLAQINRHLVIYENPALNRVDFNNALRNVGSAILILLNPSLPNRQVNVLPLMLGNDVPSWVVICGNLDGPECSN
jgi:hypothetical protein